MIPYNVMFLQHAWMMPLASTLSLMWIAGALFFSSRFQRILRRHVFNARPDSIFLNILAHTLRFFGFVPRRAPQRGPAPPGPLQLPNPHRGGGANADAAPAIRHNSSSLGNQLIMRDGEFYTPQGKKVLGMGENMECSICLESLKPQDRSAPPVKVLQCSHVFHSSCIADWFERHELCPTCRDESSNLRSLRDFFFT